MAKADRQGSSSSKKIRKKITTVYMDEDVARAAKIRAATTGMSVSDQVNRALKRDFAEDERDLRVFKERAKGSFRDYDAFLAEMKRNGQI